jgi:hypothetical protein
MPWDKAQRKRKNKIVKVKVMILVMMIQVMDLYPSLIIKLPLPSKNQLISIKINPKMKWFILEVKPKKLIFVKEKTSLMMM